MEFKDLILKNRSYRRFAEQESIPTETLRQLVNLARLTPSGSNKQPLKYIISNTAGKNRLIFDTLAWAGYLKDWAGPEEGERPSAYIVVLGDTELSKDWGLDPGIAMQSMLLAAAEKGLGGCMFGAIKRQELAASLNIPERYVVVNVVALGKPVEQVVLEDVKEDGSIRYYRDDEAVHHVPKRSLDDVLIG